MKDIKYRGLTKGGWKYGFVMRWAGNSQIWENTNEAHNFIVDEKTIQQFTGLRDSSGKEIYEGDILSEKVEVDGEIIDSNEPVFWNEEKAAFCVGSSYKKDRTFFEYLHELNLANYRIVGNIYEN